LTSPSWRLISAAVTPYAASRSGEDDAHLAVDAADALDLADAGNSQQRLGDVVVDEPRQLGRRLAARALTVKVSIGPPDVVMRVMTGSLMSPGRSPRTAVTRVAHVVDGAVDVLAELELDRGRRDCRRRRSNGCGDVADGGDRVLDDPRHLRLELGRRRAGWPTRP
jgi:hypothetical protein